ncbi:HU family DNA-binding protein [Weissella viridescens]|uniref:HU family DNA-binding protein n=1 Tax=Weissella viridescens TaxID=1629 RepID=UPI003AF2B55B
MAKRKELVAMIAAKTGNTKKDSEVVLTAVLDFIKETLAQGESLQLTGFGTFLMRDRGARTARNLHTGELLDIPATTVPAFKPGKDLKDAVK